MSLVYSTFLTSDYKENANVINRLHKAIEAANIEADNLYFEFKSVELPAQYMQQLIDVIKENEFVYEEWLNFLELADIPEPEWKKNDYTDSKAVKIYKAPLSDHVESPRNDYMMGTAQTHSERFVEAQRKVVASYQPKLDHAEQNVRIYKRNISQFKPYAEFYISMQRKILADERLGKAWQIFIAMVKLTIDGKQGITG